MFNFKYRWINCTVEIVREDVDQWGEIYPNETGGIGVIGSVVEDRADVGISKLPITIIS